MSNKSFISLLFDLSFTEFVTTRIIKVLFIIGVVCAAIGTIACIIGGFSSSSGLGVFVIVVSPILFLLLVLFARLWFEMLIVVFRIAENTSGLVDHKNNSVYFKKCEPRSPSDAATHAP